MHPIAGGLELDKLFDELKRRNVIRVAVAYLVAGWLVLQVADIVLDAIQAPDWVMQVFLLVIALGLPITIIISWAYELTPDGLKLQSEVDRSQSIRAANSTWLRSACWWQLLA